MIGFHSVMERPDPVSLVIPPSNTWIMIITTPVNNQIATGLEDLVGLGLDMGRKVNREFFHLDFLQQLIPDIAFDNGPTVSV